MQCAHFNPRSRVGNDKTAITTSLNTTNFNPRSRVGNDQSGQYRNGGIRYFNPRSRVGNDRSANRGNANNVIFQSTFPRGERQQILTIFRLYFCIGITNLHFTSLLLSEFFILFISFVRFFKFFMVRVSLGFSVCF